MNAFLYCVCVFKSADLQSYKILVITDILSTISKDKTSDTLLYIRHYTSMQDAIGHKLFLESISSSSLENQILAINPKLKNLKELFN